MSEELAGRTAVITGGSRGIGRAIATAFAEAGARTIITGRTRSTLVETARAIDGDVAWAVGSVRKEESADAAVSVAIERFGSIDILVNNAATNPHHGSLMTIDSGQMAVTAASNQAAIVMWSRRCWDAWMCDHGGVILNIASLGGLLTDVGLGYYSATKAAVLHLTRQLALELAPGVRVNAIAPGLVRTDMARVLWEEHEHEVASTIPLGRIGEPDDLAPAALFLASDASRWITGSTLIVDGGMAVGR